MTIDEALNITGFSLCTFKASEGDQCDTCRREMDAGENVYYERTSHESDEGNYHCEACVIAKPSGWEKEAEYYEKLGRKLYG